MFAEVKTALSSRISGNGYDDQIVLYIKAGAQELTRTGDIIMPGEIDISFDAETGAVTDNSTVTDEYFIHAVALYCMIHIGNPPDREQLKVAYAEHRNRMTTCSEYTDWEG